MTARAQRCDSCGWVGKTYRTRGLADRAFTLHSCDRERRRRERADRGRVRRDSVDRTPKPCLHRVANHRHGTYACYVLDQCRCGDCSRANASYEKQRVRRIAYGRPGNLVDASTARDHVATLQACGLGLKTIARRAGISAAVLSALVYGKKRANKPRTPNQRITVQTHQRILAVNANDEGLPAGTHVPGIGSTRRVQALMAIGWSGMKIAQRLGMDRGRMTSIMFGPCRVTAGTARAIAALYDELWDSPPPSDTSHDRAACTRAVNLAEKNGWAVPMAWDDDALDDPDARPFEGAAAAAPTKTQMAVDLLELGYSMEEICRRVGMSRTDVGIVLRRRGFEDQWRILVARSAQRAGEDVSWPEAS